MFEVTFVHFVSQEVIGKYSCPVPRPGEMVVIEGNPKYEGKFLVQSVNHTLSQEGCTVLVTLTELR